MNIVLVYKEDYPWDVRIEKIARTLQTAGHNVTILARNRRGRKSRENVGGLNIVRLPKFKIFPKSFRFILNLPFFLNPLWIWAMYSSAIRLNANLIIVRDLPLVGSALIVGRLIGTKTICDMAECYPLMYRSIQTHSDQGILDKILKNPKHTLKYEKCVLPGCDHVWAMIEESRDRLVKDLKLPKERVSIVSNTPFVKGAVNKVRHTGHAIRIVYVGFLSRLRGLDLLLAAVSALKEQSPDINVSVDIIGKGKEKQSLIRQRDALNLHDSVNIHGWLDQPEVDELINRANVGVLTYRVCEHWDHTIPNKIFDYMSAGLPVLATPVRPIKRILDETGAGIVADSEDPNALAHCLTKLVDAETRQRHGDNGHQAVKERFNWENDAKILLSDINRLN